jgi:CRISPR-associated endonuclease/helicase Cas3
MIEQVFSKDAVLPTSLTVSSLKAQGQDMSEASLATANTLKIAAGYQRGDIGDWWSEAKTPSVLAKKRQRSCWQNGQATIWSRGQVASGLTAW